MYLSIDNYSMRTSYSNNQMLLQQPQRRYNVKVDKTMGPVILRYDFSSLDVIIKLLHLIFRAWCVVKNLVTIHFIYHYQLKIVVNIVIL